MTSSSGCRARPRPRSTAFRVGTTCRLWTRIASVGCILVASCDTPTEPLRDLGPVPDGAFTTDATGYVARRIYGSGDASIYRFTLISRFENRGAVSLYLGRCFPNSPQPLFTVVLADSPSKASGFEQFWACVGHDKQFEILPGGVRIDTLQVVGPNAFDGRTQKPFGPTEGQFRLYFDVRLTLGDGAMPAPESIRVSNAFVVSH
jgi:hypothetical protein